MSSFKPDQFRPLRRSSAAFTLGEFLIASLIVGVLVAITIPVTFRLVELGKRTQCVARLKSFSVALVQYGSENRGRLPQYSVTTYPYKQPIFVEKLVKVYMADDPRMVECPANAAGVPRTSFEQGWMRYAYFGGLDPASPAIARRYFEQWREAGMIPDPSAVRLGDSPLAVVMSDVTTDPQTAASDADINHLSRKRAPIGGNRLHLDGHVTFVSPDHADIYQAGAKTLYR